MWNRIKKLKGEITWVGIGQGLGLMGGFASVKILTNVLGPQGYGELAFGLSLAGLLQMYVYGPAGQLVVRFLSINRERNELPSYFEVVRRVHLWCGTAALLIGALAGISVGWIKGANWGLIVGFGFLYGIVAGLGVSFSAFQLAMRQRKVVAIHQALDAWLRPTIALALILMFGRQGFRALLGFAIATMVVDMSQIYFASRNSELRANWLPADPETVRRHAREMLRYGTPFVAWAGIGAISMYGDRWMLQYLFGSRQLGIYAAIYQVANAPVSLIGGFMTQLFVPVIFDRAGALTTERQAVRSRRLLFKSIALFGVVMVACGIVLTVFSRPLLRLLTSPVISEYSYLLWVIFFGIVLYQIGQQMVTLGQIHRQMARYIPTYAVNAAATLLFSYVLGRRYGITGIAMALCISNGLYVIAVAVVNRMMRAQPAIAETEPQAVS